MIVTIAIPFYNAEGYLEYAIQSVLNQTYEDFELILIDDGSNDNSLNIAEKFKDSRIRVLCDGLNKGLACRLNETIQSANGYYYARMDADDIMHYDRIRTQVEYMESHPKVDVLGTSCYIIDAKNRINKKRIITTKSGFVHPSVMGKTEWFKRNPYNEKLVRCQDRELWFRTWEKSTFRNLYGCFMFYREDGMPQFKRYWKSSYYSLKFVYRYNNTFGLSNTYIFKKRLSLIVKAIIFSFISFFHLNKYFFKLRASDSFGKGEMELAKNSLILSLKKKF